jgi:hypothetical protein
MVKKSQNEMISKLSADELNKFFTEEPQNIVNNNIPNNEDFNSMEEKYTEKVFSIPIVTENRATLLINELCPKKATGSDGIPLKFIKLFKFALIPILVLIMNLSIRKCIFPTSWKIAKVFPLFKSGSTSEPNNYRPISLLPVFGKIIEKHIQKSFSEFLRSNKLLSDLQFGFKKCHSTVDTVLSIIRYCANALNKNNKCVLITLDLKKAFDVVNKDLLLHKLRLYGCDLSTIEWFKSYLKNRYQFVVHNDSVSNVTSPALSVAQGSCLLQSFLDSL